jgi:hypothetical protein
MDEKEMKQAVKMWAMLKTPATANGQIRMEILAMPVQHRTSLKEGAR